MMSAPSLMVGAHLPNLDRLLGAAPDEFSLVHIESETICCDIQWFTSAMTCSSRPTADAESSERQRRYSCVSSEYAWWQISRSSTFSSRSAVYVIVNVQCYYRVCETADRHSPQEVRWKLEGLGDSSHGVCCGGGTRRRDAVMNPLHAVYRRTAALRRRLIGTRCGSRHRLGRSGGAHARRTETENNLWRLAGCGPTLTIASSTSRLRRGVSRLGYQICIGCIFNHCIVRMSSS